MGAMKNMKADATKGALRPVPTEKWGGLGADRDGTGISWDAVDAEQLAATVHAVTDDGAAILFGRTSDGGALVIQILSAGGKHKLYPSTPSELDQMLRDVETIAKS